MTQQQRDYAAGYNHGRFSAHPGPPPCRSAAFHAAWARAKERKPCDLGKSGAQVAREFYQDTDQC